MSDLRILYIGTESGTCLDRANAFRRLGHEVRHLDPRTLLPATGWMDRIAWRVGGDLFGPFVASRLRPLLAGQHYDLCHVDGGAWITPGVIAMLREHAARVVNYNIDDPLGPRDGRRFSAYRRALPCYDLAVVMREQNVAEAKAAGARNVLRVFMSADEVMHAPRELTPGDRREWDCDVLFLGTWMPERGPLLVDLVRRGVPLTIRGSHWHKAPEWPQLQPHWHGGGIYGDDYAKAIQCARVNLGLLSKGNRDLHTTRSLEIPSLGALLCAERTSEHMGMYLDGVEAAFWSDAAECAAVCKAMLADEHARRRIAARGRERLHRNGHLNQAVLTQILAAAGLGKVSDAPAALHLAAAAYG